MNNEEKILSVLETINGRLENLEAGQAKLEAGQAKLEGDLTIVRGSVVRIENEHGKKLDALLEGHALLHEKLDRIEQRVSEQDETILKRVFPMSMGS